MILKFHKLYINEQSRRLTRLANIILFIEDLLEEVNGEGVYVFENDLYDPLVFDETTLNIKVKAKNTLGEEPPEELNISLELVEHIDYDNMYILYDTAVKWFLDYAINELGKYITRTDRTGVEYYLAILEKGYVFLAEGEKHHIRLPLIKTFYMAHTHPTPYLMFSSRDIDTVIDLFTYGGIVAAVMTGSGILYIYRKGYFTDVDYYKLRELRKYLTRGRVRVEEVNRILGLGNVRLHLRPF